MNLAMLLHRFYAVYLEDTKMVRSLTEAKLARIEWESYQRHFRILQNVLNGQMPLDKRELNQLIALTEKKMSRLMGELASKRQKEALKQWAERDRELSALIKEIREKYPELNDA